MVFLTGGAGTGLSVAIALGGFGASLFSVFALVLITRRQVSSEDRALERKELAEVKSALESCKRARRDLQDDVIELNRRLRSAHQALARAGIKEEQTP